MDAMSSYTHMRSHITPIPTPPIVRISTSVLVGGAVAVLTTSLAPGVKFGVMAAALAVALIIPLAHPYRSQMKMYRAQHGVSMLPTIGQMIPLFLTWLALMLAPLFSSAALWLTVLVWVVVTGWMFLTFPHVDGSRALAFVEKPRNT